MAGLTQKELYEEINNAKMKKKLLAPWSRKKFRKLTKKIYPHHFKMLDVGANRGYSSELFPHWEYHGVDIIKSTDKRIKTADITKGFPYKNKEFDIVFTSEVIEHVFDTDFFLKECNRVLKPEGYLLLTTPNSVPWHARILTLFGKRPYSTEARAKPESPGHVRSFVLRDLKELFRDHNFKILKVVGRVIFPGMHWLADYFPRLSTGFYIIARKIDEDHFY